MERWIREHGLSLTAFGLFVGCWIGQAVTGFLEHGDEARAAGQAIPGFLAYLGTSHFWEATLENWESEYLQLFLFVVLTATLFQKGSPESKDRGEQDEEEDRADAPWPVRRGGLWRKLYENSLSLVLAAFFLVSFVGHAVSGAGQHDLEQRILGQPPAGFWGYVGSPSFWFQSFQNWQSEFLAVASMAVLTIGLRQKGSPESKPVGSRQDRTE